MNRWKMSTLALSTLLVLVVGRSAVKSADAEPSPMEVALHDLRHAKEALEHAAHDHGGHRSKAVERTKEAIHEVEEGINWARDHH